MVRVLLVLGLALLTACSGSSNKSGSAIPSTAETSTSLAPPSSTTSTTAPATTTTAPGVDRCTTSSSQFVKLEGLAATGHALRVYSVRNTSGRPCRVMGYPRVALLDASGRALAQAQQNAGFILPGRPPTAVSLAPGQLGYFGIESTSVCAGDDPGAESEKVQLTLPDDTVPAVLSDQIVVCPQPNILVSPIRATKDDVTRR